MGIVSKEHFSEAEIQLPSVVETIKSLKSTIHRDFDCQQKELFCPVREQYLYWD